MRNNVDFQSRYAGEGADLNLLHWLRHAEQAIELLAIVRAHLVRQGWFADQIFLGRAHAMYPRSTRLLPQGTPPFASADTTKTRSTDTAARHEMYGQVTPEG